MNTFLLHIEMRETNVWKGVRKDPTADSSLTHMKTMQVNDQEIATVTILIEASGSLTKGLMIEMIPLNALPIENTSRSVEIANQDKSFPILIDSMQFMARKWWICSLYWVLFPSIWKCPPIFLLFSTISSIKASKALAQTYGNLRFNKRKVNFIAESYNFHFQELFKAPDMKESH